jgi:hypothetical protein
VFVILYSGGEKRFIFEYTFDDGTESWSEGFVDLPVNYEDDIYRLEFDHTDWPVGLDKTGKALMLSGNNASDDLFMYCVISQGSSMQISGRLAKCRSRSSFSRSRLSSEILRRLKLSSVTLGIPASFSSFYQMNQTFVSPPHLPSSLEGSIRFGNG